MRTGEVEKLTEVKEANIKFYEREGLINPRRNENGYRDFRMKILINALF